MSTEIDFDVFLSYNKVDKDAVENIAHFLREAGLKIYLDRWNLVPGTDWQDDIEKALNTSLTYAVFLGAEELGPWDHVQMRAALTLQVEEKGRRVIPVLLPGADWLERSRMPLFLTLFAPVDFRSGLDDAQARHELISGIKGIAPSSSIAPDPSEYPFRGLQVFEEPHAKFFFGREALSAQLVKALKNKRFLSVTGPSGGGKSSLVRAGMIPQIRQGQLDGSQDWPIVLFKPGPHPLAMLAARLIPETVTADNRLKTQKAYLAELKQDESGLHRIIQTRLSNAPDNRYLLLVVDQFEELFTLCTDDEARSLFIANLLYASGLPGGQTLVVVTMRADFFGHCADYPALAARLSDHHALVGSMQKAELRRAIEEPARLVKVEYEKGLVDTILGDLGDGPGRLPLLQHTLWMLWEEGRRGNYLTTDKYHEIGGVQGALAQWADNVYGQLKPEQQELAKQILLRLTKPGEKTEDTRRRASLTELLPDGRGAGQVARTIDRLVNARLLTAGKNESNEGVLEIAHEALIRHWPLLRGWINEDRANLLLQSRLTDAADEWKRKKKEVSYLFLGSRLTEIETKLADTDFSPLEREFVQASVAARTAERQAHRYRRLRRIGTTGLFVMLLTVIGFIIWQTSSPWNQIFDNDQVWSLAATNETLPTYYLGTKDSGLRRSTDGVNWTKLDTANGLPRGVGEPGRDTPAIQKIAIDGQNPKHLFAFVSRHGLYQSLDAGDNWQITGSSGLINGGIIDLAVWGDLVLFVTSIADGYGLYASQDSGQNWNVIGGQGDMQFGKVYTVHIDNRGEYLYVGAETGFHRFSLMKPIDSSRWEEIDDLLPVSLIESSPGDNEIFYLVTANPEEVATIYSWQPGLKTVQWQTDVEEQPIVLVPYPDQSGQTLAYILFINNRVFALQRNGQMTVLNREPAGIALALVLKPHPSEDRLWLLLGHENGLFEYAGNLNSPK
ncbi:MAG: toll/interleukin-1 receptor domain-containing protein [Ardenticatenaceae bacterium]|nr:toll/interleukin-1 receptor domain-containing protein [Ardenticatenaceae bacterium]